MITYQQSSGLVYQDATPIAQGWAGRGEGKNNPDMQSVRQTGPLPQGIYHIDPWETHHAHLGPMVAHLSPDPGNEMFGRNGFYIHGPSTGSNYGEESMGCIVVPHEQREMIMNTGEEWLTAIA